MQTFYEPDGNCLIVQSDYFEGHCSGPNLGQPHEPAGEAHTLVVTDDSPEPALVLFIVEGGLIYLDKAVDGGFGAYEDGFTVLELCRKYYREAGLDARELDLLIR